MLVPRTKLLFWVAVVVLPFALLGALAPEAAPICVLFVGALGVVALVDAVRAPRSLAGIGIELPPVARMSKDREGKLEVRIRNEPQRRRSLRVALGLPGEISTDTEEMDIVLPADSAWSRLVWTCVPVKRGNYRIDAAYVEAVSYLGFWSARKAIPVQSEIRVYPDLLRERKNLAALFLNRGSFGLHVQRQVGKGRDFEKLREYVPGDSFDDIHWKATARRGKPITKVFQIERTQEIYVVVDASRLSARQPILERFVTAALVLGLAAEQQGDLFGLLTFTDGVDTFVRARSGKTHYSACRDALYTLQPQTVTPDFDELCTFIRLRLRRRALIVLLTSLDDPALAENFVRNVDLIRRQHLVMVNMIRQPGTTMMFSEPNVASVDDLYRQVGGHLRWQKLRQLEKTLQRRGILFSLLENERLSADLVSQYLSVKQRQLI
ncbi:MAG TPA: DUF58 domain-containing protein [Terriglobia bacterium]|nr:DUF58 domain-containing protein [Terriglobia bacterium]